MSSFNIETSIRLLESYCIKENFAGHSKFDALNSPIIEATLGFSSLTRLLASQAVNRIPLPLRHALFVRKERNPKGIANFLKGYCIHHQVKADPEKLVQIRSLADWLLNNSSVKRGAFKGPGLAWGYNFPWQSPGFFAPRHAPNCIVSTFVGDALLAAHTVTGEQKYLEAAKGVAQFILEALPVIEEDSKMKCIGYVQSGLRWRVININAVAGGFLSKLGQFTKEGFYCDEAIKMARWVVSAQNKDASWNYTKPKSQSGIGPDNYHTGGILDGLYDCLLSRKDEEVLQSYRNGLEYYEKNFFSAEGAPKWRQHRHYPYDVHGAAQGILTFCKASTMDPQYLSKAKHIIRWTIQNLQDPETGQFFYQKRRFYTWKLSLMRWNNSWMFWALNEFVQAANENNYPTSLSA